MIIAVVSHAVETNSGSRAPIELAKQFAGMKNKVYFFAYSDISNNKAVQELKSAGVTVVLISSPKIKLVGRFVGGIRLAFELKKIKPNIVSTQAIFPFILGVKLSRYPIIHTYMGMQLNIWSDKLFPKKPNLSDKIINFLINFLIKASLKIQIYFSNQNITFTKYCSKEVYRLSKIRAPSIMWGGFPKSLTFTKLQPKTTSEFRLLSVSRIVPYKGFHRLIKAVNILEKKYPQIRLTIIGSHPQKNYLHYLRKIKSKNTKIIINATDQVLARNYQSSDVYVTADRYLFFGLPIFEAASFKKGSVAFDFASAREMIINKKSGFVVSGEEEFIKTIIKLINSPVLVKKLGNNAYNFVNNHTWEKTALIYMKYFRKWQKM